MVGLDSILEGGISPMLGFALPVEDHICNLELLLDHVVAVVKSPYYQLVS